MTLSNSKPESPDSPTRRVFTEGVPDRQWIAVASTEHFDDGAPPWEPPCDAQPSAGPDGTGWGCTPINWAEFWTIEATDPEWVIEPLFPAGRQTAIYSPAKTGKSLLVLDMVAAAVTGRSVLGQPAKPPIRVVYLDLEMTEADLRERLVDLGYGPDDDLSGLAYYQLPSLPPLDTELGGMVLAELAEAHRADLVIIDTMARVVSGDENSADTYRDFYRHTGLRLKQMGVALGRLDHMGKDADRGQRGASAKNDDIDVVYKLTTADAGQLRLKRTHQRVSWMADELTVIRHEDPNLRHAIAGGGWPAGVAEVAEILVTLEIPADASGAVAMAALTKAGQGRRRALVLDTQKYRRSR